MANPLTTVEILDRLRSARGWTSDYQLWKALGWKQTTVSKYRVGDSTLSRAHAIRAADELGLPRAYLVACVELEREHQGDDVRAVWREIAERFRSAAAIILIAVTGLLAGHDAPAATSSCATNFQLLTLDQSLHYAKWRGAWQRLKRSFAFRCFHVTDSLVANCIPAA